MTVDRDPPERSRPPRQEEKNGAAAGSTSDQDVRPWPELVNEDQWAIELMEDLLDSTEQDPDELRARAAELRKAARKSDPGQRAAALALADRYDQAAASRHAHR